MNNKETIITNALDTPRGRAWLAISMTDPFGIQPPIKFQPLTPKEKRAREKAALLTMLDIWDHFHNGTGYQDMAYFCKQISSTNCSARDFLIKKGRMPNMPIEKSTIVIKTKDIEQYSTANMQKAFIENYFETKDGKEVFLQTLRGCYIGHDLNPSIKAYTLLMVDKYSDVPDVIILLNEIAQNPNWPVYQFLLENGKIHL